MKFWLYIILFISVQGYGQRIMRKRGNPAVTISDSSGSSACLAHVNNNPYNYTGSLHVITDTLLSFSNDDINAWRDRRQVEYYYDTTNTLQKVRYRDGGQADYLFYFRDHCLEKADVLTSQPHIYFKFCYSEKDNEVRLEDLEMHQLQYSERLEFYKALLLAKEFYQYFNARLRH